MPPGISRLGLTHAVCLADLGHDVVAIDIDEEKIAKAASGEAPFFEPGLEPLLRKNLDAGRLRFTTSFAEVGAFGEVHFLCVGTPEGESGQADLGFVHGAVDMLAPHLASAALIVGKSTVPVGTARQVLSRVRAVAPAGRQVDLAWNPEFLREGFAVQDSLTPDRIVEIFARDLEARGTSLPRPESPSSDPAWLDTVHAIYCPAIDSRLSG